MESLINRFRNKVLTKRKALGMSQVVLAELSNVSLPTIQKIESGGSNPTLEILLKIADSLGFTLKIKDSAQVICSETKGTKYIQSLLRNYYQRHLNSQRQNDELLGVFFALKNHYPSIFKKLNKKKSIEKDIENRLKANPGRLLKHARISLTEISHLF